MSEVRKKHNHYHKSVEGLEFVDVYRVLQLFNVTDPCIQHAVKKLLVAGGRGAGKDVSKDIQESIDSLVRWQEMRAEDARSSRQETPYEVHAPSIKGSVASTPQSSLVEPPVPERPWFRWGEHYATTSSITPASRGKYRIQWKTKASGDFALEGWSTDPVWSALGDVCVTEYRWIDERVKMHKIVSAGPSQSIGIARSPLEILTNPENV